MHIFASSKRGQVLSYDAIGGIVIFLIAVGILVTYWSSISASFNDSDSTMVLEANTALDNLMSPRMLLEADNYHINASKFKSCSINKEEAGIFHEYYLQVLDKDGVPVKVQVPGAASPADGCGSSQTGTMPTSVKSVAVAERLAYYHEAGRDDIPVKIVLKVYTR